MTTYIVDAIYSTSGGVNGYVFQANAGATAGTVIQQGDYIIATLLGPNPGGGASVVFSQEIQVGGGVSGTVQDLFDTNSVTPILYNDPRMQDGEIVVIFADNPAIGSMQISTIPATLIDGIGGEGFDTFSNMIDRTGVVVSPHFAPQCTIEPLAVLNTTNEKWIRINDSRNAVGFDVDGGLVTPPNGVQREFEASVAVYVDPLYNPVDGVQIQLLKVQFIDPNNNNNQFAVHFEPDAFGTPIVSVISGLVDAGGFSLDRITHDVPFVGGTLFYITIRIRSESAVGARDGRLEMFINGQVIRIENNIGVADNAIFAFTGGDWETRVKGTNNSNGVIWFRNMTVWNGWTSDDMIPPDFLHVVDFKLNTVTGANVTNVGGANEEDSVTDNNDTTYVETVVPSDSITLSQTGSVDPALDTRDVRGFVARTRVSRSSLATNTINVELGDGTNTFVTTTHEISTVEPSRESLSIPATTNTNGVNLDNIQVTLTNGA